MKAILAIAGFVLGAGVTLGVLSVLSAKEHKEEDICGEVPVQDLAGISESEE